MISRRGFVEKCSCVKIWCHVLTLPIAMLSMRLLDSATVLYSNSYYTVVASIFLVSAASCKAICEVTSVRTSDYSQPFRLKWHALLMPHMLIKYAYVLICISAGKGSWHFSAFIDFGINVRIKSDSNDSRIMYISCKIIEGFTQWSNCECSIILLFIISVIALVHSE